MIKKKIKRAVTDSGTEVKVDKARSGISNLVQLYSLITDISIKDVESQFSGKMYSYFKSESISLSLSMSVFVTLISLTSSTSFSFFLSTYYPFKFNLN